MKIKLKLISIAKLGIGLSVFAVLTAGCSGGSSSGGSGGAVTGVATPSKVSVVNTN